MLIGLSGPAGSGKDTVCKLIQEWGLWRGVTVRREAFADRLKLSAARLFFPEIELEPAVAWCNALKETGRLGVEIPGDGDHALSREMSGRVFLQRFGTESHREVFGHDFWVSAALNDLSADYTIVTDVRFPNEALELHRLGGELWRKAAHGEVVAENHVSETALPDDQVDAVVPAFDALDELRVWIYAEMDLIHEERLFAAGDETKSLFE